MSKEAKLSDILTHSRIWRGLSVSSHDHGLSTGFAELDELLPGNGWPAGVLIECLLARVGLGELALLLPTLKHFSQNATDMVEHKVFWFNPPYVPYAPALHAADIDCSRMVMVRVDSTPSVLWSIEQVLKSGHGKVLLCWLDTVNFKQLRRLQLAAEGRQVFIFIFRHSRYKQDPSPSILRCEILTRECRRYLRFLKIPGASPRTILADFLYVL